MKDTIYREDALFCLTADITNISLEDYIAMIDKRIRELPSAEPEPAIPLSWIEGQIKWLKSLGNAFSTLTAVQISAMVNKWRGEQND